MEWKHGITEVNTGISYFKVYLCNPVSYMHFYDCHLLYVHWFANYSRREVTQKIKLHLLKITTYFNIYQKYLVQSKVIYDSFSHEWFISACLSTQADQCSFLDSNNQRLSLGHITVQVAEDLSLPMIYIMLHCTSVHTLYCIVPQNIHYTVLYLIIYIMLHLTYVCTTYCTIPQYIYYASLYLSIHIILHCTSV